MYGLHAIKNADFYSHYSNFAVTISNYVKTLPNQSH